MTYKNREEAGRGLASLLRHYDNNALVMALPRGGVVVGVEVARGLGVPFGLVLVRKIASPMYSEYAVGAVAEDDEAVYDQAAIAAVDKSWLRLEEGAARELIRRRRERYYGGGFRSPDMQGKTVIVVDDGMATGLTMRAAVQYIRKQGAKRIVVAVPVASAESVGELQTIADEIVVLEAPAAFKGAVGAHYQSFNQVADEEVRALLYERTHHDNDIHTYSRQSQTGSRTQYPARG